MRKIGIKKIVINNLPHRAVAMRTAKFLNEIAESEAISPLAGRPSIRARASSRPE